MVSDSSTVSTDEVVVVSSPTYVTDDTYYVTEDEYEVVTDTTTTTVATSAGLVTTSVDETVIISVDNVEYEVYLADLLLGNIVYVTETVEPELVVYGYGTTGEVEVLEEVVETEVVVVETESLVADTVAS